MNTPPIPIGARVHVSEINTKGTDVLSVPCPKCTVEAGATCRTPKGRLQATHQERRTATRHQALALASGNLVVACPHCRAVAGTACRGAVHDGGSHVKREKAAKLLQQQQPSGTTSVDSPSEIANAVEDHREAPRAMSEPRYRAFELKQRGGRSAFYVWDRQQRRIYPNGSHADIYDATRAATRLNESLSPPVPYTAGRGRRTRALA